MNDASQTSSSLVEAAGGLLCLIEDRLPQFTSSPDHLVRLFAAAGLARCCAFLKGIMILEGAGLAVLATGLARQHWETWLVSLYVLLGGDAVLRETAGDDIHWKRKLAKSLKLGIEYHVDWAGETGRLNYRNLYDRLLVALQQAGESVDTQGVSGYDVAYGTASLFGAHANITTITAHIRYEPNRWSLVLIPEPPFDRVLLTPLMHTVHLAQYVFKEFGFDATVLDPIGDGLVQTKPQH